MVKRKKTPEKITMFITDHHIPYMDECVDELTVRVAETLKPDTVVIGGDLVDWYQISKFNQNPFQRILGEQHRTLRDDAMDAHMHLRKWRELCKRLVFLEGNHEERLNAFLGRNEKFAIELGLHDFNVPNLMALDKVPVDAFYPYKPMDWSADTHSNEDFWIINQILYGGHGYRYSVNAGYVCNHMIRDFGCSGITGHNHKVGHSRRRLKREQVDWFEVGCQCKINPNWKRHANWTRGFAAIYHHGDRFTVENVTIEDDYTCRLNGINFTRKGPR